MPTYDYECNKCEHRFERFQSITEKPARKCPACGRMSLRRLIGPGGAILFKGSGFYTTDYRSKEYRDKAKAEKSAASTAASETKKSAKSSTDSKESSKDSKD